MEEATELWIALLKVIKREAGFDNIVFIDLCNEIPGFLPGYMKALEESKFEQTSGLASITPDQQVAAAPEAAGAVALGEAVF